MGVQFSIEYRNRLMTPEQVAALLRCDRWTVSINAARACLAPHLAGRVIPEEVVVRGDGAARACSLMKSIVAIERSRYSLSFGFNQERRRFAGAVLLLAVALPDTFLTQEDFGFEIAGDAFIDRLRSDPEWYWGFGSEPPAFPFVKAR